MGIRRKKKDSKGARVELPLGLHCVVRVEAIKTGQTIPEQIVTDLSRYYQLIGLMSNRGARE